MKIGAIGTVRVSRRDMPKYVLDSLFVRSHNLIAVSWMNCLLTVHTNNEITNRNREKLVVIVCLS